MDIEELREHCLIMNGTSESFPFNEETLVFKVASKMFCLLNINPPHRINLKSNPENVIELIEEYEEIIPGYHMNKKYWITVSLEGNLTDKFILDLIKNSYNLVYENLTNKEKQLLENDN